MKQSLFSYIEGYYNKKRPHEANGGLSPDEKEAEFWRKNIVKELEKLNK